jgi:hypothetical protein
MKKRFDPLEQGRRAIFRSLVSDLGEQVARRLVEVVEDWHGFEVVVHADRAHQSQSASRFAIASR